MNHETIHTIVIGSGAAGLAAALRLNDLGIDAVIYTDSLERGTSINAGSDKQTYYKLGLYGQEQDSPFLMAQALASGGSMHGDIALVEAALSPMCFARLCAVGVPFPHDCFGQYIGYKTDHDPRRRATSCGPYTSREMCLRQIEALKKERIPVREHRLCISLLTDSSKSRVVGAVFLNTEHGEIEAVHCENIVFAVGGPGGLYQTSVYPVEHIGGIGLALEAGAIAANLAESQFGLASISFRWNVSGSYMQSLPRFYSTDSDGNDEREFLMEWFSSPEEMLNAVFLKGYQWPFAAAHSRGSSLIDIFVYVETMERGRRVWLDYRRNPDGFSLAPLSNEAREYLERSNALLPSSPLERLQRLNAPAIELYRQHGIDLSAEPLEIAVCAQHNNGGLAGTIWWESVNIKHLFPIGEVSGTHGVTRPGGSALNSGQVGAWRAAEFIASEYSSFSVSESEFRAAAERAMHGIQTLLEAPADIDWMAEWSTMQHRMSTFGAFIRRTDGMENAVSEAEAQLRRLMAAGMGNLPPDVLASAFRIRSLAFAQLWYLTSIREQIASTGSRGGSIVLSPDGEPVYDPLGEKWRIAKEQPEKRKYVMLTHADDNHRPYIRWEPCRPIPETHGWFETEWKQYRNNLISGEKTQC